MKYRKYISILLAFVMLFALAACGGGDDKDNTGGSPSSGESIQPSGGLSNTGSSGTEEKEDYSWWEGEWYGRWMVFDGTGYYVDYIDYSFDCCMVIEPYEGDHLISIWDEDFNSYEENCLAEVLVEIDLDKNEAVSLYDSKNYFWDGGVGSGDWVIDAEYAGVENMLLFESSYTDTNGDYLEYGVLLTKWGHEWNEEDSAAAPYYYEDYFLPLMEQGKQLPSVFDPE